ncbi:MAG: helix-turn-helix transcriptional regulator [Gammaproteobacteria bacterium]
MLDTFELRLAHLLLVRGLTQGEFAKGLEASPTFISNMIRGTKKPGTEFLVRIATQYQVSLDWLLLGKGNVDGTPSIESPKTIDIELFRMVNLRAELACNAANGNVEAKVLADELLGKAPSNKSDDTERQALLNHLSEAVEHNVITCSLYNRFLIHSDPTIRAREVLTAALAHFQSSHADPLAAMVASRDSTLGTGTDKKNKPNVKQKIFGFNNRTSAGDYKE